MSFVNLSQVVAEAEPLAERFTSAGFRIFLVGGVVRDLWLDRDISAETDLDLTTDAPPREIKELLGPVSEALWLQGERFGTIGARVAGRAYEITTHRSEVYEPGSRKPEVVFSKAIEVDLSRRDFTVNAMAVELPSGALIDPFEGSKHLASSVLTTPLAAEVSFADDPLRMLRAARFVAGYGLNPTTDLTRAMATLSPRLDIVSAERIRDELDKLLLTADPALGLDLLAESGLLERFLPELTDAARTVRGPRLSQLEPVALVRLAALMYGVDPDALQTRLRALRFSTQRRRDTRSVLAAVQALADDVVVDAPSLRRWIAAIGDLRDLARNTAEFVLEDGAGAIDLSRKLEDDLGDELDDLAPALTGTQIMRLLGIGEGRGVGEATEFVQNLRFDAGPISASEVETRLLDWWGERGL